MKRPRKIGSSWLTASGKYLHGPRRHAPEKFERIWLGKPYKEFPASRPVMGKVRDGGIAQQSTLQSLIGLDFLNDVCIKTDKGYVIPMTIKPSRRFDGAYYTYIGLTQKRLPIKKNLRIMERKLGKHTIYLIYRRRI